MSGKQGECDRYIRLLIVAGKLYAGMLIDRVHSDWASGFRFLKGGEWF